jgi:xanthine/uracil/vitamin C permease (AzgA family)
MAEALQVVVGVSTPIALAAVSLVVLRFVLARFWAYRERVVASMPENARLAYFDDHLRRWGFDIANLTRAEKAEIVRTEQKNRQGRAYFLGVGIFAGLVVISSCLVLSYVIGPLSGGKDEKEANNVALVVSLGFRALFGAAGLALVLVGVLWTRVKGSAKAAAVLIGGILILAAIVKPFKFETGNGKTNVAMWPKGPPPGSGQE